MPDFSVTPEIIAKISGMFGVPESKVNSTIRHILFGTNQ